ncbi:MAG: hypothetical protein GC158_07425 [Cyanobacteria bacterium RI_101]|nr:hypothetical protein [Cyanobacteria bacterium RI_101]
MADAPNFLSAAESEAVERAALDRAEKFLARLTLSSWRLLALIAQDRQKTIQELTPEEIVAWFEIEAKLKRERPEEARLGW